MLERFSRRLSGPAPREGHPHLSEHRLCRAARRGPLCRDARERESGIP
jgi:hypothetical protein